MARLAYTFPVVETIGLYVEALPGYSTHQPAGGTSAKGFVLAFGAGADMEITNRIFANSRGRLSARLSVAHQCRREVGCSDQVRSREPGRRRQVLG